MESRESQRDKRIKDVLQGRPSGGGNSPSAAVMRAREEIQGIEAERAANLEREKIIGSTRQQQMATMKQAALLGASGMAASDAPVVSPLAQQAAAMNPQTQAILQKYGVKPGPRTTMTSTQQSGPNIRTTTTTNNNVRNEIRIVQPQIPMRQQQIAVAGPQGKSGNLDKFKTWLDSSFAKQANEYEVQQKEYRKREWNLARSSSKLFQKLSESTKSLGEKMDPRNMGNTFGGQLKTMLFLFLATTISKWWGPLMKRVASFEAGFRAVFGLPINADLEKSGAKGVSFIDKIKEFIGINTKTKVGKNTSLLEGFYHVVMDGVERLEKLIKLFIDDRRIALQKINLPDINVPKVGDTFIDGLGSVMKSVMGPTTDYLGKILSALIGGTHGLHSRAASKVESNSKEFFKKESGGMYFTSKSTDFMGNLNDDSTYGMSKLMSGYLSDKSPNLHTGELMTGMKMLEGNAKKSGGAVISPDFLKQLGFGESVITKMLQSGQAEYVPYKVIKVPKSVAEAEEYSGGSWGSYVGREMLSDASAGLFGGTMTGNEGWGRKALRFTTNVARFPGKVVSAVAPGLGTIVGTTMNSTLSTLEGSLSYASANAGNSEYVLKAVPLTDKRPGEKVRLLKITPEGFNTLKREADVESFDTSDVKFQRWIEGKERARKKAIMGVRGKLTYRDPMMTRLNQTGIMAASYDAEKAKILNDPNYTGRGDVGNIVDLSNNTATAIASGLSWMANGLNDVKYKLTGSISPLHIPAGEARRNAERGIKYLMDKYGLSKEAVAGIAGVIQRESGWNPGAQNLQEKGKGYKGFGRGLCQWSNNWGIKDFPEWYQVTYGEKKYPDEVPLEHQLDYLMTGLAENGIRKKEFLKIIHKPGVTVEEATKAMLLGYENGNEHLASFSDLAKVKAYGGVSGVNKMYADRASAALGFYNIIGGSDGTGFTKTSSGEYTLEEDADENGQAGLWNVKYSMTEGKNGAWDTSKLELADPKEIAATLIGQEVNDSLKLGDWFVGRSIKYLAGHASRKSTGYCARHVRLALVAGGINDSNHPAAATDYIHYLPKRGFARIPDGSRLQPGDICVQPAGGIHRYGHICMFTGKVWVSDFIQDRCGMIVYNHGKWPSVLFRYTGKGGSGSDSLIDPAQNYVEPLMDGAGYVAGKAAEMLAGASDKINPNTDQYSNRINPKDLNIAQRATYEWAKKMEGVKEDKSGLYIDDTKNGYRHYIDLNSGISNTGLLTQANILGTFKLKNGVAFEAVSDTTEADVSQNSLLSTVAGKLSKFAGTGKVIDYTLPNDYGAICNRWTIRYNVYEIAGDGSGFNTILVPTIPLITKVGIPERDRDGKVMYPKEYEYTGTPKSGWSVLYSREFKIKSMTSGVMKNYELSPYLHGSLKIDITSEAMEAILDILRMIRGEMEMSKDLKDKLGDLKDTIKKEGSEFLKTELGINKDSIDDAIKKHKKGEEADRFRKDVDGNVIDTKLGIEIYNAKTGYIKDPEKFLKDLGSDLSKYINDNLQKITAQSGLGGVKAENSYERYQALHTTDIFKDPEKIKELKERLSGDLGYSVSIRNNLLDRLGMSSIDKKNQWIFGAGKYKAILDKNGNKRYILDVDSLDGNARNRIEASMSKEDWGRLSNFGFTSDEFWHKFKLAFDDNRKKSIDWSNFESIIESGLIDEAKLTSIKDDISVREGLKNLFGLKDTKARINDNLELYKKSVSDDKLLKENGFSEKNGYLIRTNPNTGRSEAFGKITENGAVGINDAEEYSRANSRFIKNPSEKSKYFDFKDKTSWYASKFGAKPIGSTGRMYIDLDKNTRFAFNVNELGYNDDIQSVLRAKSSKFLQRTSDGSGDKEYFSDGDWKEPISDITNGYEAQAATNIYELNKGKLLKNQEDWNSEENKGLRKKAFEDSWNTQILEDRVKRADKGGIDESNAHLGSLEDINKNQLRLLGIIAENTTKDKDKNKIKTTVEKLTNLRTITDLEKEKKRKAAIRDAFYDALKQAGELGLKKKGTNERDIFYNTRDAVANKLGISIKDIQDATGIKGYGKYASGLIHGKSTVEATIDAKKTLNQQSENVKADAANISAKTEIQKIEEQNAKTMADASPKLDESATKLLNFAETMEKMQQEQKSSWGGGFGGYNDLKTINNNEGSHVTINVYNKSGFNPPAYIRRPDSEN